MMRTNKMSCSEAKAGCCIAKSKLLIRHELSRTTVRAELVEAHESVHISTGSMRADSWIKCTESKAKSLVLAAMIVPSLAMAADAETVEPEEGMHVTSASPHTVTANAGLASNYLYRGISQTGAKPAVQGGFDYAHSSGLYAGVWGSSISWLSDAGVAVNAGLELDTYAGFKGTLASGYTYDVGFLRYNYPGTYTAGATRADTNEIYGAIGNTWITAKYAYALSNTFGVAEARGTRYLEVNASYAIPDTGVTVGAHYGKQTYKGPNAGAGATSLTYSDYKLGATGDLNGFLIGLAYSKTDASAAYTVLGNDLGKGTVVLSVIRLL